VEILGRVVYRYRDKVHRVDGQRVRGSGMNDYVTDGVLTGLMTHDSLTRHSSSLFTVYYDESSAV
jgi:hypothetical protein